MEEETAVAQNKQGTDQIDDLASKDNGLFDYMTADRAIELYKEIIANGLPKLDWNFYGRRKPGEAIEENPTKDANDTKDAPQANDDQGNNDNQLDDFDFDEEFGDITAPLGDSLRLKKRQDSERRTNLSDIMSDIMKESHTETIVESSLVNDIKDCSINVNDSGMLVEIQEEDIAQLDDPQLTGHEPQEQQQQSPQRQEQQQQQQPLETVQPSTLSTEELPISYDGLSEQQQQQQETIIPTVLEEQQAVDEVVNEIQTELMRELDTTPIIMPTEPPPDVLITVGSDQLQDNEQI